MSKWFWAVVTTLGLTGHAGAQNLTFTPDSTVLGPVTNGPLSGMRVNPSQTYFETLVPAAAVRGSTGDGAYEGYIKLSSLLGAAELPGYVTAAQLFQQYNELQRQIRRSYEGNAIGLALAGASTNLSPGKNYGLSMNFGTINGYTAVGAAGVVRVNEALTVHGGIGVSGSTVGGHGGMNFEW